MKKFCLHLLLCLAYAPVGAQTTFTARGIVTDSLHEPLAFPTLRHIRLDQSIYGSDAGLFSFANSRAGDTVLVSAIGYQPRRVVLLDSFTTVRLRATAYTLAGVRVLGTDPSDYVTARLGVLQRKIRHAFYCNPGLTVVTRIDNERGREGILTTVRIWADLLKGCPGKVRLRAYTVTDAGLPGEDITPVNNLFILPPRKKVHAVDISDWELTLGANGIYLGVETIGQDANCRARKPSRGATPFVGFGLVASGRAAQTYHSRFGNAWHVYRNPSANYTNENYNLALDVKVKFLVD